MKKTASLLFVLCISMVLMAQRHEVLSPRIASLQVTAGDDWQSIPIITLGQETPIVISFDDLTHEYHRYSYRLEHCEADWTISDQLFDSDFCIGFSSGNTIDDFEQSTGVNQLYTHYQLQIPNRKCQLKMSGNYRLTVYDEQNDNTEMFKAYFMVVEPTMHVGLNMTTNTDADINGRHQQLEMRLNYGGTKVTEPTTQIKSVVLQNGRWDNAVVNSQPQYVMGDGLQWSHD
ncbi:MAG: DUF5103 domain-containing protein, partial [Prevotella sp.]|nr:DUF5103 domain-containing protein [Prevotella sp.]